MAVATFDTLKFANSLKAAGVPEKQAEAEAAASSDALAANFKDLASKEDLKSDLHETEQRLNSKIDAVEQRLNSKIDAVEQRLNAKNESSEQRMNAKIEGAEQRLHAKIDTAVARLSGELVLMKYMFGMVVTIAVGLMVRLIFVRVP